MKPYADLDYDHLTQLSDLSNISPERLKLLSDVLSVVMALPTAREAFAQIIDGRPTRTSFKKNYHAMLDYSTVSEATEPSKEAIHQYKAVRKSFTPSALRVNLQTAQAFQDTAVGTLEHQLRLLEIAAASINALGGMLYSSFHPDTEIRPQRPPGLDFTFQGTSHFYVDFYHSCFVDFDRYPRGLLDVVGYWAELQIFGGVLLFDRGDDGSENLNAYIQSQHLTQGSLLSAQQLKSFCVLADPPQENAASAATDLLPFRLEEDCFKVSLFDRAGDPPLRVWKNIYDKPRLLPNSGPCLPPVTFAYMKRQNHDAQFRTVYESGAAIGRDLNVPLSKSEQWDAVHGLPQLAARKGWLKDDEMKERLQRFMNKKIAQRSPDGGYNEDTMNVLTNSGIPVPHTREDLIRLDRVSDWPQEVPVPISVPTGFGESSSLRPKSQENI